MSNLCSQLARCPACSSFAARAAFWLCQRRPQQQRRRRRCSRWRQKGKVQSVARLHSSRLPPHLLSLPSPSSSSSTLVALVARSTKRCLLSWLLLAKYLAAAVVSISVSIVYCSYCCCLLLFLLYMLLVVSASSVLHKLHIFVLFYCTIWNLIGNVDVHPCSTSNHQAYFYIPSGILLS